MPKAPDKPKDEESEEAEGNAASVTISGLHLGPKEPRCPDCKGPLLVHSDADPSKAGALHCNACGVCWRPDLSEPR